MPTALRPGHDLIACLPREDVRDAFISHRAACLEELAGGAVVGTASLRRQAMVRRLRPDIAVVTFRGNVDSRLRKLADGVVDATLLAFAGLKRLGRAAEATAVLDIDAFLPAVGQGAVGIEARAADRRTCDLLATINHAETLAAVQTERAFLTVLDGSCRTPIAGHAQIVAPGSVVFRGMVLRSDGTEVHETTCKGAIEDGRLLGAEAARELKGRTAPGFFAAA
jgi:hydroxymethylbilane synthase